LWYIKNNECYTDPFEEGKCQKHVYSKSNISLTEQDGGRWSVKLGVSFFFDMDFFLASLASAFKHLSEGFVEK